MTGAWKRRERTAARALGSARTVRRIGESAPDMAPVTLPCGVVVQGEVKHRARLPALIVGALGQAARYTPGAVPVAIVSERNGPQLACLYLSDLARLLGLDGAPTLPRERRAARPPKPRKVRQLTIPGCEPEGPGGGR